LIIFEGIILGTTLTILILVEIILRPFCFFVFLSFHYFFWVFIFDHEDLGK